MEFFTFKKGLGQNFLESRTIAEGIVNTLGPTKDDFVIEIGPGAGALSFKIAERCGHLAAIELDPRLVKSLREKFADNPDVKIVFDDIMLTDLDELLEHEHAGNFKAIKIAGNIPYNITTPIITKVLESGIEYENFTLMIQKEVALRIASPPGKKSYGYMSVFVQYYCEAEYIMDVGRENFLPVPAVDSAVVKLTRRTSPPVKTDREIYFDLVRQSFSKKRKTLANNLTGYRGMDKARAEALLKSVDIDPSRRAETLTLEEFDRIAQNLDNDNYKPKPQGPLSKW